MKLFTGWVLSAGLVLTAAAAQAQSVSPYMAASDIGGPYAAAAMPPAVPAGYGPTLLPSREVYTVLRDNGFSPLGTPRQRGFVYTISALNRDGDDGRLVIDARNGQIIRFVPAYRMGSAMDDEMAAYGPAGSPPPVIYGDRRAAPVPLPHVASRTSDVPMPKPAPHAVAIPKSLAAKPVPAPAQQSAAVQKPADAQASIAATPAPTAAKPVAPAIEPTKDMPAVQGLE
jgi:hypothetical protein